jgi:hypothetical protein
MSSITSITEDGQTAVLKPFLLQVPVSIFVRDVLEQRGAHLTFNTL